MARSTKAYPILPFRTADRWFGISVESIEGVAPLPHITAIPGNQSRAIRGFVYLFGQLMTVIDCAPLMNLGMSKDPRMVVVIKHNSDYYALISQEVRQLMSRPTIVDYKRPLFDFAPQYITVKKTKCTILDIGRCIDEYICT